ncbi:MAG TPA: heparan-alpha-glucosaminide N-acetyltransferase domain-containing protein, partial [Rubrivivax sp.]|nr:heparan-alpha-glucosaminide N-acetyltransferase domain-containing protein [Rubrivivax sp.]
ARLAAPLRGGLWLLGAVALGLPWLVRHPFFDTPLTHWVGLVTRKPVTEDWVPVLPWLGVMLWGLAGGQWLLRHRRQALAGEVPAVLQPLSLLGRWPLSFYMLHQPVFIGVLMGGRAIGFW